MSGRDGDEDIWSLFDKVAKEGPRKTEFPFGLSIPAADINVLHAEHGRLMNGGLRYFFEYDPIGRLDYEAVANVYRRIGADQTASSIVKAASSFPFSEPHIKCDCRLRFMEAEEQKLDDHYQKTGEYNMLFEGLDRVIFDDRTEVKILAYLRSNLPLLTSG